MDISACKIKYTPANKKHAKTFVNELFKGGNHMSMADLCEAAFPGKANMPNDFCFRNLMAIPEISRWIETSRYTRPTWYKIEAKTIDGKLYTPSQVRDKILELIDAIPCSSRGGWTRKASVKPAELPHRRFFEALGEIGPGKILIRDVNVNAYGIGLLNGTKFEIHTAPKYPIFVLLSQGSTVANLEFISSL